MKVEPLHTELEKTLILSPEEQNDTNNLQLRVFWNAGKGNRHSHRLPRQSRQRRVGGGGAECGNYAGFVGLNLG